MSLVTASAVSIPRRITVMGAGSWGLTLAWLLANHNPSLVDTELVLWDRNPSKLAAFRHNPVIEFPVKMTLPNRLVYEPNLATAIATADIILLAVTSNGTRQVLQAMVDTGQLQPDTILVNVSKGIEFPSLKRISVVIQEVLPHQPMAVLSGPNLAQEILNGLPTASVVASANTMLAEQLQQQLSCENRLRLYSNVDVIGVELGGALKNIFAIVSGYMQARQLGDNAIAAMITRGLAEMTRFSLAQGANPQTLYGLSGLGDLLATCHSPLSRNYQVGYRLAQGQQLEAILADLKVVAEGVLTAKAVSQLCENCGSTGPLDMPILRQVEAALSGEIPLEMLIKNLMGRKLKSEHL